MASNTFVAAKFYERTSPGWAATYIPIWINQKTKSMYTETFNTTNIQPQIISLQNPTLIDQTEFETNNALTYTFYRNYAVYAIRKPVVPMVLSSPTFTI